MRLLGIEKFLIAMLVVAIIMTGVSFYLLTRAIEDCGGVAQCLGKAVGEFDKARENKGLQQ